MARKRKMKKRPFLFIIFIIAIGAVGLMIYKNRSKDLDVEKEPVKTSYINRVSYDSGVSKHIAPKAEETIIAFMDLYYRSVKELKVYDLIPLFASDAYEQAQIIETALSLLIDIRTSQANDLSLTDCSYDIKYYDIKEKDGNLIVNFYESNNLKFKFMGNVPSKSYNIKNTITLKNIDDEYKVVAYEKVDDFYNMINDGYEKSGASLEVVKEDLTTLKTSILRNVNSQIAASEEEYTAYVNGEVDNALECDHSYDRTKAANYAKNWVNKRNLNEWDAYDAYGGNCNNYASQAILTGGIPMDYTGPITEQWKYYAGNVIERPVKEGRSYSWTGVNQFYSYAKSNKGYGMCAKVDVNLYLAEPGDIIQVGSDGVWTHTVIVVDVIKNDEGKVIDILIDSNSIDRENYPVSAYNYANKRLIKIYGWNE